MKKIVLIVVGVIGLLAAIFGITTAVEYNVLVGQHEEISYSRSQIVNSLETRDETLAGLATAVDAAIELDQAIYDMITAAREAFATASENNDLEAIIAADNLSSVALTELYAVIEDNPDIKSQEAIQTLMANIESLENALKVSRSDYNESVREYNVSVRKFPRNIFANMFQFEDKMPYWSPDPDTGEGEIPDVLDAYSNAVYVA
ncbi:MAG: LemA family protein [Bacilli bacterium]|jgi:LemA protein